jgi:hypothetical protein
MIEPNEGPLFTPVVPMDRLARSFQDVCAHRGYRPARRLMAEEFAFLDDVVALDHLAIVFLRAPDAGKFEVGRKIFVHRGCHFNDSAAAWHAERRARASAAGHP